MLLFVYRIILHFNLLKSEHYNLMDIYSSFISFISKNIFAELFLFFIKLCLFGHNLLRKIKLDDYLIFETQIKNY